MESLILIFLFLVESKGVSSSNSSVLTNAGPKDSYQALLGGFQKQ